MFCELTIRVYSRRFVSCSTSFFADPTVNAAFLALMRSKRPIFPAFETTLYSDAAYGILGLVLAHMTGLPYADAMQRTLFEPLGLNGTSAVKPSNEGFNGLVIPGTLLETSWGYDDPILAPYVTTSFFRPASALYQDLLFSNVQLWRPVLQQCGPAQSRSFHLAFSAPLSGLYTLLDETYRPHSISNKERWRALGN